MTEPLTPRDCDLRNFQFMPLDIVRLFGSRFHAIATDAEWRAGVTLWLKSFHQIPAGSIPNDDVEVCRLAELGRDLKTWHKVKTNALHGWVLCTDGRLYHPTVCEKANEAWHRKKMQGERSRKGNAKRWGGDPSSDPEPIPPAPSNDSAGDTQTILEGQHKESPNDPAEIARDRDRDRDRELKKEPSLRSGRVHEATGSRLPDEWQPSEPGYDGATPGTLAKFRDYWRAQPGAKGRKADWDATWRNWCRRDAEQPKPKLHTLPQHEQDRRILAAVGLRFDDPAPVVHLPARIAQ